MLRHIVQIEFCSFAKIILFKLKYKVQSFEASPLLALGVEICLYGVVFIAGIATIDGRYYVRAQRAPCFTQGAVHLAKIEPHDLSVHLSHKVEVAPREFKALAERLAGRAIESPCHAHNV